MISKLPHQAWCHWRGVSVLPLLWEQPVVVKWDAPQHERGAITPLLKSYCFLCLKLVSGQNCGRTWRQCTLLYSQYSPQFESEHPTHKLHHQLKRHTRQKRRGEKKPRTICHVPKTRVLTAIAVGLDPVSILQPVAPGTLVSRRCVVALPDPVPTLKTMTPLSSVDPLSFILHTEPVPLPLGPVALVGIPARPSVYPYYLKTVRPGPGVFALALGSGADAVSVGFAILPPPAVSATVVEVKPSARHSDEGWK